MIIKMAKKYLPFQIRIIVRKFIFRIKYLIQLVKTGFRNDNVFCPIKRKFYRQFLEYRYDKLTPSNGAWSRHRLLWLYLIYNTDLLKRKDKIKLLHPSPELCFYEKFIRMQTIDYYPSDISEKGLLNIDLTDIQYPDNYFDYIICNHILEHIPDDIKAIKELYRVLKDSGTAIIMVPINEKFDKTYEDLSITTSKERERHFGQWDHVRWYGMDIKERFISAGFYVEMIRYSDLFDIEMRNNMGLCDDFIIVLHKRNI